MLDVAIEKFLNARQREGKNIERDLIGKIETISRYVDEIDALSANDTRTYRQKLEDIEKYRKGDKKVRILDQKGAPVSNK